jgi:hypothetical protein
MAKRKPKKTDREADARNGEQGELSTRMRDLILVSTVEERRTSSPESPGPADEQRRRDDAPPTPEERAS